MNSISKHLEYPEARLTEHAFFTSFLLALRIKHGSFIETKGNEHWKRFAKIAEIIKSWPNSHLNFRPNMTGQYREWDSALYQGMYSDQFLYLFSNGSKLYWTFSEVLAEKLLNDIYPIPAPHVLKLAEIYNQPVD